MKYPILIQGKHRANGKNTFLKAKRVYHDEKGSYIRHDKSTWYVEINDNVGLSVSYRKYEGD